MPEPVVKPPTSEATLPEKLKGWDLNKLAIVGALCLALGVTVGVRVAKLLNPPKLPERLPCPDCERRKMAGAVLQPGMDPMLRHRLAEALVDAPPPPPITEEPVPSFSAQALPANEGTFADENLPDG